MNTCSTLKCQYGYFDGFDVFMRKQHLLFERLKALLFVLQLLLHAGQVSLQLIHLKQRNTLVSRRQSL